MFIIRAVFLSFFALNAWNTLTDLNKFHLSFKENYIKLEKAFTSKTNLKFPSFMASSFIDKNSAMLLKAVSWTQLALCAIALFVMPGLTSLVGLIYFVLAIVEHNAADFSWNMKMADFEPFSLAVALLAASVFMSLPGLVKAGERVKGSVGVGKKKV